MSGDSHGPDAKICNHYDNDGFDNGDSVWQVKIKIVVPKILTLRTMETQYRNSDYQRSISFNAFDTSWFGSISK